MLLNPFEVIIKDAVEALGSLGRVTNKARIVDISRSYANDILEYTKCRITDDDDDRVLKCEQKLLTVLLSYLYMDAPRSDQSIDMLVMMINEEGSGMKEDNYSTIDYLLEKANEQDLGTIMGWTYKMYNDYEDSIKIRAIDQLKRRFSPYSKMRYLDNNHSFPHFLGESEIFEFAVAFVHNCGGITLDPKDIIDMLPEISLIESAIKYLIYKSDCDEPSCDELVIILNDLDNYIDKFEGIVGDTFNQEIIDAILYSLSSEG